jgi:hypothetical protein
MKMMIPTFKIIAALALAIFVLTSCESKNEQVKRKVRSTMESVTPEAILEAAAVMDSRREAEDSIISLDALPDAISAFDPIQVRYRFQGSYLVVTELWNQHRTGMFISAPTEVVPASTKYITYEKLAERIYLYQD